MNSWYQILIQELDFMNMNVNSFIGIQPLFHDILHITKSIDEHFI